MMERIIVYYNPNINSFYFKKINKNSIYFKRIGEENSYGHIVVSIFMADDDGNFILESNYARKDKKENLKTRLINGAIHLLNKL